MIARGADRLAAFRRQAIDRLDPHRKQSRDPPRDQPSRCLIQRQHELPALDVFDLHRRQVSPAIERRKQGVTGHTLRRFPLRRFTAGVG